jgi:hypothetical protein
MIMNQFSRGLAVWAQALLLLVSSAAVAQDYDFRRARWGMSKAEVKASEAPNVADESAKRLYYETAVLGKNVVVVYAFVEKKLVRAGYLLREKHSNRNDYINDFNEFKAVLSQKYGDPIRDETVWRTDLYRNDPQHWGFAVSLGHLVYRAEWRTPATTIRSALLGNNYKVTYGVNYASKELKSLEEQAKRKQALSNF